MTDDEPDIEIVGPQFERADGREPADPPTTEEEFEALRKMTVEELQEMGLRKWDGSPLMLLPAGWFEHIPEGVEVSNIKHETSEFRRNTHSNDRRFGCLAYGIYANE